MRTLALLTTLLAALLVFSAPAAALASDPPVVTQAPDAVASGATVTITGTGTVTEVKADHDGTAVPTKLTVTDGGWTITMTAPPTNSTGANVLTVDIVGCGEREIVSVDIVAT